MQIRQISKINPAPNLNRLAISLACAAFVSAGAFAVQSAKAQSDGGRQVSSLDAQVTYDQQTLKSFATAAATVLALRSNYYPRIRAAEIAGSDEKAGLLFQEMRDRMHIAIANSGFSADQYRAISSAAKTDTALRGRINSILRGPPPAQQHVQNLTRVTPQAPQVAAAPSNAAPVTANVAPATPQLAPPETKTTAETRTEQPVDNGARQRLEAELSKTNAERDRYRAAQAALQEKVQKLERQLSAVKSQDSRLRQQLDAKKKQTLAEQKKSAAELEALHGEVTNLKDELSTVQSRDTSLREQLEAETVRADAEKSSKEAKLAAFRGEIKRLAGGLAAAQQALDSLAVDLKPGENRIAERKPPSFEALTPLRTEPNSIERILAKVQPHYAKRQELDSEIARIQKERMHREAERTSLHREIAELSRDLAATYQVMAGLIGEPTNIPVPAEVLDIHNGTYALDFSQETAQLFEGIPTQFDSARADPQANMRIDDPIALGIGDPVIEQGASGPADSATLEPSTIGPLRVNRPPAVQIATVPALVVAEPANSTETASQEFAGLPAAYSEISIADVRPSHQIVRDENEYRLPPQPEIEPATPDVGQTTNFRNSVGGGVDAYRATDYNRAYQIWSPLAESGNRSAQFHLGALHLEGRGTEVDYAQAYFWLRVSAYSGDERALPLLTIAAGKLTSEEIRASEDQAKDWLQQRSIKVTQFDQDSKNRL